MKHVLLAAVLAIPATAFGQYAVDRSGANDRNPQVGSGGRNFASNNPRPWEVANAIVEGTITGGKAFRGGSQSSDPRAFRGVTAGLASATLTRDASGITTSGVATYNANREYNFYGDNLAINTPLGYRPIGSSGAYVPPRPSPADGSDSPLNAFGNFDGSGATGPQAFGAGADDPLIDRASDSRLLSRVQPISLSNYTTLNRAAAFDPNTLERLRDETRGPSALDPFNEQGDPRNALPGENEQGDDRDADAASVPDPRSGGAVRDAVDNEPLANQIGQNGPKRRAGDVTTLDLPEMQSTQFQTLRDRQKQRESAGSGVLSLPESEDPRVSRANNAKAGNEDAPVPNDAKDPANPGATGVPAIPGVPDVAPRPSDNAPGTNPPGNDATPAPAPVPNTPAEVGPKLPKASGGAPVKVTSLATGVKSKTLADLLTNAEKQLREGQYVSAIETYDAADRVVPNNPLIRLGRGHAELGASYYLRAERTLRQTLAGEPALLEGQYDLRAFLGEERLLFLDKELKDLVRTDEKNAAAPFLLAYIYYNTGNEARASAFLQLAQDRAKGDKFLQTVRSAWFEGMPNK